MVSNSTSQLRGRAGGLAKTEKKRLASIANMEKAKAEGLLTGRPSLGCNCDSDPHKSMCRVYKAEKSREYRARRKAGIPPRPKSPPKPLKDTSLDWLLDGLAPRRPEQVGRNRKGNKKRKLFVNR